MKLTATEWRRVWEELTDEGQWRLADRIASQVSAIWNGGDWGQQVEIDFGGSEWDTVCTAADEAGICLGW